MFAIKAENLSKVYKKQVEQKSSGLFSFGKKQEDFYALKDINFEIKKGETVGIIGGNGAGKSTLLKILSGITYPTSGRVTIEGRISSLLEVGTGFHPELTGRENIYLNGALLGMSKAEITAKFDEIVDFSGIESFIETPVKNYSSGMYVRLAFSVAAHLQTEIILLDEVLAVGDAQFYKKCLTRIEGGLKNNGTSIILVSHDLRQIKNLCNQSLWINKGRLEEIGNSEIIISNYLSCYGYELYNNSWIDLNEHKDKKIKNIGLLSVEVFVNDKKETTFIAGDKVVFKLKYNKKTKLIDPEIGIVIKTVDGINLFGFNNKTLGIKIEKQSNEGEFHIEFASIKLYGNNKFYYNLYFGDVDIEYECLYDVGYINGETSDYFKSGWPLDQKWNLMVSDNINIY
jgi:lipopolysaccharide transport system ATP-binding protein